MSLSFVRSLLSLTLLLLQASRPCLCQTVPKMTDTVQESYYTKAVRLSDPHKFNLSSDSMLLRYPLPTVEQLGSDPSAVIYLRNYLVVRLRELIVTYRKDTLNGKVLLTRELGQPFDSVMSWGRLYGDDYIGTLYARKIFTKPVQEKYIAERLLYYCENRDYTIVKKLYETYSRDFPEGPHAALCRQRMGELQRILAQNERNAEIVFRADSGKVSSVEQLLAPYKGRYVYLDIWGSWCGPCREEMKFTPALKEHFSGRDIVFLYLDMDEDRQDERWKSFVRLENITGQHLRMEQDALEKIWQVVSPGGDGSRSYPSYFIFDKDGKALTVKARRPSEKEALYRQLEEIINK